MDEKRQQRDYHIALNKKLNERLIQYINTNFTEETRVFTMIFRKAIEEYLDKREPKELQ